MSFERAWIDGARAGDGLAALEAEVARLLALFEGAGALRVEPAVLQRADVLLDLYGEDIRARAFVTSDGEAEMMLRPDFTVPVVERHMAMGVTPARYAYAGSVWRRQPAGAERAAEYLQRTVGARVDGQVGVHTLAAVRAADPRDVVARLCAARLRFLRRIRDRQTKRRLWDHFGRGWQRRLDEVETLARQLAGEAAGARGKGSVTDVRLPASGLAAALLGALRRALARLATTLINAFIKPGRSS